PLFLEAVEDKQVDTVIFLENSNTIKVQLSSEPELIYKVPNPKTEDFTEFLLVNNISLQYGEDNMARQFLQIALIVLFVGGVYWFSKKRGMRKDLIKDTQKKPKSSTSITLDHIAGNIEAKAMVEDMIGFIKDPETYTALGASMPK